MKFNNPTIRLLLDNYRPVWSLMYANHLINWDTETYMPSRGVVSRSKVLADLNLAIQRQLLDKEFLSILKQANEIEDLNIYEQKALYYLNKNIEQYTKLPAKFIADWSELIGKASTIWTEARKKNDFKLFEPLLAEIFSMTKVKAEYLGYKEDIYDVIFDSYEDGLTTKELDSYFNDLKIFLKTISLTKLSKRPYLDMETMSYSKNRMRSLNAKVLKFLGHDTDRFRLDVSAHPFSLFLSPHDLRLTTRYPKLGFNTSLMPTIHEFGHALGLKHNDDPESLMYRLNVSESIKHSWYDGDWTKHPWEEDTVPKYSEFDANGKYSWVKSPRFAAKPMQVGPLAQVLAGLAAGDELTTKFATEFLQVAGAVAGANLGPAVLHSTLGRHAARDYRRQVRLGRLLQVLEDHRRHLGATLSSFCL